jgi:transposase-like protein
LLRIEGQPPKLKEILGTGSNMVSRWVENFQEDPEHLFPGQGKIKGPEQEVRQLKKKLQLLHEKDTS